MAGVRTFRPFAHAANADAAFLRSCGNLEATARQILAKSVIRADSINELRSGRFLTSQLHSAPAS